MDGSVSLADRRQVIAACADVLRDLHTVVFQCPTGELGELVGELAELAGLVIGQLPAVVSDAEVRGVVADSQYASTTAWVADNGWHLRRQASSLAKAAILLRRPEFGAVAESMLTADIDPATAVVVGAEYDKLVKDLKPDAAPIVLDQMLGVAAEHGPAGVRHLAQEIVANFGDDGEFEKQQDRCRRQIDLTAGRETSAGVWDYRLSTDNEGRAILEAAIGTLAAPRPNPDGTLDARPVGRRRGEALTEALRRSVIATSGECPSTSPKAVLMLTMGYDDLRAQVGAAYAAGTLATGTPIAPDTVRKLACDAAIISVVVGNSGEILNQGREKRLFTWAQLKNLWARDHHCTFPGCNAPAAWTDAHHLIHWADGGRTDLSNAALLCGRHHTIVHRDHLAGTVTDQGVVWDLRPGSYNPPDPPVQPAAQDPPRRTCQAPARTRPGRQSRTRPCPKPSRETVRRT